MPDYKVLKPIVIGNARLAEGVVKLSAKAAATHVSLGRLELIEEPKVAKAAAAKKAGSKKAAVDTKPLDSSSDEAGADE